jgi:hypothetical protein
MLLVLVESQWLLYSSVQNYTYVVVFVESGWLLCRPSADDVMVLKQELIQVQMLMDQMTQQQEKEKEQLEKDNTQLTQQLEQ